MTLPRRVTEGSEGIKLAACSALSANRVKRANPVFFSIKKKRGEIIPSTYQRLPLVVSLSTRPAVHSPYPYGGKTRRNWQGGCVTERPLPGLSAIHPQPKAPPAESCCRGPGAAQLQRRPMVARPGHRPASVKAYSGAARTPP